MNVALEQDRPDSALHARVLPRALKDLRRGEVFAASRTCPSGQTGRPELLCIVAANEPGGALRAHVINGNWGLDFNASGASMAKDIESLSLEAGTFEACATFTLPSEFLATLQARMSAPYEQASRALEFIDQRMREEAVHNPAAAINSERLGPVSYFATVPILFPTSINRAGAGFERYEDDGDSTPYHRRDDIVAALTKRITDTGGQDLARYCSVDGVTRVTLSVTDHKELGIEFRCSRELQPSELIDLRDDFIGQLSDGWGENFEQSELLGADDEIDGEDCTLEFAASFDCEKMTLLTAPAAPAAKPSVRPRLR